MLLAAVSQHESSSRTSYDVVATILTNPMTRAQTSDFYKQILAAHPAKADAALWNVAIRAPLPEAHALPTRNLAALALLVPFLGVPLYGLIQDLIEMLVAFGR